MQANQFYRSLASPARDGVDKHYARARAIMKALLNYRVSAIHNSFRNKDLPSFGYLGLKII